LSDCLAHRKVHTLIVVWEILHVLAIRWMLGIDAVDSFLTFSLNRDVKLRKSC